MAKINDKLLICSSVLLFLFLTMNQGNGAELTLAQVQEEASGPWWVLPLVLFLFSITVGIVSALAGVGGAVLFVPVVSSLFPIHIDFVRGTGLMIALAGALYASPNLLRTGLADLKLALPLALISSISAIFGALVGLQLPANVVQISLGVLILIIVVFMLRSTASDFPIVQKPDFISKYLGISGIYCDKASQASIPWQIHRTPFGFLMFLIIGFLAGMFGLGAGFANVPVLNLTLGVPLKLSVGTSKFILSITDSTATWIYFNSGGIVSFVAAPSVIGMIIGTRIGVRLLFKIQSKNIKLVVIILLLLSGITAFVKGLGY